MDFPYRGFMTIKKERQTNLQASTQTRAIDGSNNRLFGIFYFVEHLLSFLGELCHIFCGLTGFDHAVKTTKVQIARLPYVIGICTLTITV